MNHQSLSSFILSIADLLRGEYKQSDYGKVILPFTVLRRMDCVLNPTKEAVLTELSNKQKAEVNPELFLLRKSGQSFYNTSPLDMKKLMGDTDHIKENLFAYIQGFSSSVRDIFEHFDFFTQIERLNKYALLYQVAEKFAKIDLHPESVDNTQMGLIFEELLRNYAEISNETAGEHFTPREVIKLMVNLLFIEDDEILSKSGVVRTLYDPTAGTGGMLSVASEHLAGHNPQAQLTVYGQELNPESYAICKADMLIKGQEIANIIYDNTLSKDGHPHKVFDYMLSNPPFGVEWKKVEKEVRKEHETQGFSGRFGPGLPRVSDGSLLFLLHLISKMRPAKDGGSKIGIVLNSSSLHTGDAGSGESEIRRYVLENDLLEAIIALPTDMFYNTGLPTYIWILSNRKTQERKGKVQLIDASNFWQKMHKCVGEKRKELNDEQVVEITRLFGDFVETEKAGVLSSKIFKNEEFGYRAITVEQPMHDERGNVVIGTKGKQKGNQLPNIELRATENVPLVENIEEYFRKEILPRSPKAWINHGKTKIGYEIPFNRHFYVFKPFRKLEVIDAELKNATHRILEMLKNIETPTSFKEYEQYKDSGVGWLENVPEHWNVDRLGTFFHERREKVSDTEYMPLSVTKNGVVPQLDTAVKTDDGDNRKKVCSGDFVINSRSDRKGSSGIASQDGSVSLINIVLQPIDITKYFTHYLLRSPPFQDEFYRNGKGIAADLWSTHFSEMKNILIPSPPLSEQAAIAAFLAKTDALITEFNTVLTLFQEQRKALISAAVTGKIDVRQLVQQETP